VTDHAQSADAEWLTFAVNAETGRATVTLGGRSASHVFPPKYLTTRRSGQIVFIFVTLCYPT